MTQQLQKPQFLGTLAPAPSLVLRTHDACYEIRDFTEGAEPPSELLALLKAAGYESAEPSNMGLLLTFDSAVLSHTDEMLSVAWLIRGRAKNYELAVGGEFTKMRIGDVVLFDARLPHAFMASDPGEWSLFSMYVSPIE